MQELRDRIVALREQLGLLEAALGDGSPAEDLPWIELDDDGRIVALAPAVVLHYALAPDDALGAQFGAVVDVAGDPLRDPLVEIGFSARRVLALRIPRPSSAGVVLVLGADAGDDGGSAGAEPDRRGRLLHDLANILGVMRGHAELLAMDAEPGPVANSLAEIVGAAARGQALLDAGYARD